MRKYEGLILIKPELSEEKTNSILEEFNNNVEENKGQVEESKVWKKDDLAYEIEGYQKGVYLLSTFELPSESVEDLERFCKLNEDIIRYLITKR